MSKNSGRIFVGLFQKQRYNIIKSVSNSYQERRIATIPYNVFISPVTNELSKSLDITNLRCFNYIFRSHF